MMYFKGGKNFQVLHFFCCTVSPIPRPSCCLCVSSCSLSFLVSYRFANPEFTRSHVIVFHRYGQGQVKFIMDPGGKQRYSLRSDLSSHTQFTLMNSAFCLQHTPTPRQAKKKKNLEFCQSVNRAVFDGVSLVKGNKQETPICISKLGRRERK